MRCVEYLLYIKECRVLLEIMLTESQVINAYESNSLSCNLIEGAFDNPRYWLVSPSLEYLEKAASSLKCDFTKYLMSSDPEVKGLALALEWREGFRNEAMRLVEDNIGSIGVIGALRYLWKFSGLNEVIISAIESPNLRVVQEALTLLFDLDLEVQSRVISAVLPVLFNLRDDFIIDSVSEIISEGLKEGLIDCQTFYERLSIGLEKASPTAVKVFTRAYADCLSPLIPLFVDAVHSTGLYQEFLRLLAKGIMNIAIYLPLMIEKIDKLTSYDVSLILSFAERLENTEVKKAIVSSLVKRIVKEKKYHLLGEEELVKITKFEEEAEELRKNLELDSKLFWNASLILAVLMKLEGKDPRPYIRAFESQFKGEKPEWVKGLISKLV